MTTKYEIWIFPEGSSDGIALPVLPESISIDYGCGMTSLSIDGLGELAVAGDRQANRISFSSIFPTERLSGRSSKILASPWTYVEFFRKWAENASPLRLSIVGAKFGMYCIIESFKVHEQGGDVGTKHYSVSFVEHRQVKMRKISLASGTASKRVDNRSSASSYTVKSGDFLIKIAREQLGDSSRYMEIFELNRDILSNPDQIYSGQVLKLP